MTHPATRWHALTPATAIETLSSSFSGLAPDEAAQRLAQHGPNGLQTAQRFSPWAILTDQFKNVLTVILLAATTLSFFLGHSTETVVIAFIVLFAVVLGFVQEYRAERAIEALKRMSAPTATVLRNGEEYEIPARDLFPGDALRVRAGDKIPADLRLVEAVNLRTYEAALTDESVPVEKNVLALPDHDLPVGDSNNMAYMVTAATYGRGSGVVASTGMETEFGKIARLLQTVETEKTPLQKNLDCVGYSLGRMALIIVAIIVLVALIRGQPLGEMLLFGIALAVAVVPEALPAVVTISLAMGV